MRGLFLTSQAGPDAERLEERGVPFVVAVATVLTLVMVLPQIVSGLVPVDWTDAAERSVVGLAEAGAVFLWLTTWRRPIPAAPHPAIPVLVVLWLSASVLATVVAVAPAAALVRTAEWMLHVAFAIAAWDGMRRVPESRAVHLNAAAAGFVLVILWSLWGKLQDPTGSARDWSYAFPFVLRSRLVGIYGLIAICVAGRHFLRRGTTGIGPWPIILTLLGWTAVWWSGSRGAAGAGVIAVVVLAACARRRSAFLGVTVVASALAALASIWLAVGMDGGVLTILGRTLSGGDASAFTSGRAELWRTTIEAWREHPWLGLGPDGLWSVLAPWRLSHPHNTVLQALGEWGLVGALPFLALVATLAAWGLFSLRAEADEDLRADVVVAWTYLLAWGGASMLDGLLYKPAFSLLAAFAAAVVCVPAGPWRSADRRVRPGVWRWALSGGAALASVVLLVHLVVLRAVYAPGTPEPDSLRVRLVRTFPSPPILREVVWWGQDWVGSDPEAALDLAAWGQRHARTPWEFDRLEGDTWLQIGDEEMAAVAYARAERTVAELLRHQNFGPSGGARPSGLGRPEG